MTEPDNYNKYVCFGCIGDPILADEVKKRGLITACGNCDHNRECIDLDSLANRIDEVLQKNFEPGRLQSSSQGAHGELVEPRAPWTGILRQAHHERMSMSGVTLQSSCFERTPDEPDFLDAILLREGMMDVWILEGAPVATVISDMAGLSEEIAEDLATLLSGCFEYRTIREGRVNPYERSAYYDECSPDDWDFLYGWESFCDEIKYGERVFPENAEPVLREIFRDVISLQTYDGTPVVREINPGDDFPIWRSRTAQSKEEVIAILEDPTQQLGPPLHSIAEAGRMNQKGIPVF